MATNYKGRTGTNWRTGAKKTTYRTTTTTRGTKTSPTKCASGYAGTYRMFEQKINSFKTLYKQTCGAAKFARPTTATLSTFANWVGKGANVYTISTTQLNRWAGASRTKYDWTKPTSCRNFLNNKFGKTTIKAIARSKTGQYMVACSPTYKGKPFTFPR